MKRTTIFKFLSIIIALTISLSVSLLVILWYNNGDSGYLRGEYVNTKNHIQYADFEYSLLKPNRSYNSFRIINKKLIYNVNYGIDENSFRKVRYDAAGKEIFIFAGCSFMFGEGLEDNQTIPYCFSKLNSYKNKIINMGYSAIGTHHVLKWLKSDKMKKQADVKPKYVIYIFIDDHIFRAYEQQKIFTVFYEKNGKIFERKKTREEPWLGDCSNSKTNFSRILYKDKARDFTIKLISEIDKEVKNEYGAKFLLVLWPGEISDYIFSKCSDLKIEMLKLQFEGDIKNYLIPYDGHPNAAGAEKTAQQIYEYIFK